MSLGEPSSSNSVLRLPSNDVADCVLLLKKPKQVVYILGSVFLRKVAGALSIHGHDLADDEWHPACSISPNLVTVECSSSRRVKYSSELLSDIVDNETKRAAQFELKNNKNVGCVVYLKANQLRLRFQCQDLFDISSIYTEGVGLNQPEIQSKTADLGFTLFFELPTAFSPLVVSPTWTNISGHIKSYTSKKGVHPPVVLICGGKNVGKSTFARYLMNKLLNTQKPLCYLETDVGQSEFTPPAVLSLTKVETPIFAPPFLHLSKPERAFFFGEVSPKDRPSTYVQLIHILYEYYNRYCQEMPLIVNTCGWVKGMGVRILLDIIRIVQPSHVIQINSESQPIKNLPLLNEEFLLSEEGWSHRVDENSSLPSPQIYQLVAFENTVEMTKGPGLVASELRSLSFLSYFGSPQSDSSNLSIPEYILKYCTVYSISLANLHLCSVCDDICPGDILHSVIGSVVGLVKKDEELSGCIDLKNTDGLPLHRIQYGECVGLGIVRNVDAVKQLLYIITPESLEVLKTVQVLVKGRLEILDCLYKKQTYGKLPYVTSEFTYNHRGSGQKRIRYNLLRQRTPYSPKPKEERINNLT